jgi:hypothetical protein
MGNDPVGHIKFQFELLSFLRRRSTLSHPSDFGQELLNFGKLSPRHRQPNRTEDLKQRHNKIRLPAVVPPGLPRMNLVNLC